MARQFQGTANVGQGIAQETNPTLLQSLIAYSENITLSRLVGAIIQRGAFKRPAHVDFKLVNSSFKAMGNMAFLENHPEQLTMKTNAISSRIGIVHGAFPQPYPTALAIALGGESSSINYELEPETPSQGAFLAFADPAVGNNEIEFVRYRSDNVWHVGTLISNLPNLDNLFHNRMGYPFRRQALMFSVNELNAYYWHPLASTPIAFINPFTDGTHSFAIAYGRHFSLQRDSTGSGEDNLKHLHYTNINETDWLSGGQNITIAGQDRFSGLAGNGKLLYAYGAHGVYFIDPSAPTDVGVNRLTDLPITIDNALIHRDILYAMSETGLYAIPPNGAYVDLLAGKFRELYENRTLNMLNPPEIRPFGEDILFPVRLDTITTDTDLMGHHDNTKPLGQWMNGIMVFNTQLNTLTLWTVSLNSFDTSSPHRLMGLFGKRSDTSANILWYDKNSTTDFNQSSAHTAVIETIPFTSGSPFNEKTAGELRILYEGQVSANSVKIYIAKNAPASQLNTTSWGTVFKTLSADTFNGLHLIRIPLSGITFNSLRIRIEFTHTDPRNFILYGLGVAANPQRF